MLKRQYRTKLMLHHPRSYVSPPFLSWLNLKPKPRQGVDFAIWCMERCRSVERGVLKCVKGHLLNDHMLNEWKMTIPRKRTCFIVDCHQSLALIHRPDQLFVKPKKNGAVRKKNKRKQAEAELERSEYG